MPRVDKAEVLLGGRSFSMDLCGTWTGHPVFRATRTSELKIQPHMLRSVSFGMQLPTTAPSRAVNPGPSARGPRWYPYSRSQRGTGGLSPWFCILYLIFNSCDEPWTPRRCTTPPCLSAGASPGLSHDSSARRSCEHSNFYE